jgi:hypothetical protein
MSMPEMKITSFTPPIHGGTVYAGIAETEGGHRYKWFASPPGRNFSYCFSEDHRGRRLREKAPRALVRAVKAFLQFERMG